MDMTPNGSAHITCHVFLGVPCTTPGINNIVLYDAMLFYASTNTDCPVVPCLLKYYNRAPMDPLPGGMYRVFIKARPIKYHR